MSQLRRVGSAVASRRTVLPANEGILHRANVGNPQRAVKLSRGRAFSHRRKKILWHRRLLFNAKASFIGGSNDLSTTNVAARKRLPVDNVGPFLFLQPLLQFRFWFVVLLGFHGVGIPALLKGKSVYLVSRCVTIPGCISVNPVVTSPLCPNSLSCTASSNPQAISRAPLPV